MGRRAGPRVTPWTQQNLLHMLRLGSDVYVIVIALSVIVSAHPVHVTFSHLLTSPLSFLVVSHRSRMKVQSARTPGSTMMVGGKNTHTNRYPRYIIYVPCIQIPLSLAQGQMVLCEICHIHFQSLMMHVAVHQVRSHMAHVTLTVLMIWLAIS